MLKTPKYDILGVGSPIIDIIIHVDDEFLVQNGCRKGGMQLVTPEKIKLVVKKSHKIPIVCAGGSSSNTMKGLASLGQKCALVGTIGNDESGKHYLDSIERAGIVSLHLQTETPTSEVLCLITPDGERTFIDYLGAGGMLAPKDLIPEMFQGVKLVHIEGYTLLNENLTERAMQLAKEAGAIVSFDLASFEIVEQYKEKIVKLLTTYVDILFANKDEAQTLTHLVPEKGEIFLKDLCEISVVFNGKYGCWVAHKNEISTHPAFPVDPVDCTGAGDLFISGFLHGYLKGLPLADCARYGAMLGSEVVQVVGAEIPDDAWARLRTSMGD